MTIFFLKAETVYQDKYTKTQFKSKFVTPENVSSTYFAPSAMIIFSSFCISINLFQVRACKYLLPENGDVLNYYNILLITDRSSSKDGYEVMTKQIRRTYSNTEPISPSIDLHISLNKNINFQNIILISIIFRF